MGPLHGVRILEFAGLGPAPMAAMVLADLGAEVLRITRAPQAGVSVPPIAGPDILGRSRRSLGLDLKRPEVREGVLALCAGADALIEGFRPGVMERLGLGPQVCLARQPRLVYARMTGWGQSGPRAPHAGHDLTYLALSGALHAIGEAGGKPVVPLNLVADGSGALLLATGLLAALLESRRSGLGQVVDAAMIDSTALVMGVVHTLKAAGQWRNQRGSNLLDGGAPFYDTYRCADGRYLAVAAIEPAFYARFLAVAGITDEDFAAQWDRSRWPRLKQKLACIIAQRSRDAWCALFAGEDACVAPVLDMDEAPGHPHHRARGTYAEVDGVIQSAPAPRFSRTPLPSPTPAAPVAAATWDATLSAWGVDAATIVRMRPGA
ncbi:MAG: CaiB/BaiF CoA-transferase family protein [Fulvimonas sp.]|nr:CaiB/BaiF CoA-transferase family protein [Fulvimonas sp.]